MFFTFVYLEPSPVVSGWVASYLCDATILRLRCLLSHMLISTSTLLLRGDFSVGFFYLTTVPGTTERELAVPSFICFHHLLMLNFLRQLSAANFTKASALATRNLIWSWLQAGSHEQESFVEINETLYKTLWQQVFQITYLAFLMSRYRGSVISTY